MGPESLVTGSNRRNRVGRSGSIWDGYFGPGGERSLVVEFGRGVETGSGFAGLLKSIFSVIRAGVLFLDSAA